MRYVALLLAALCLLAPTAAAAVGVPAAPPRDREAVGTGSTLAQTAFADPSTEFVVSTREDGSAEWTVTTTFEFGTAADRAGFEAYAARYEAGEAAGGPEVAVFRNAARVAEDATGREMAIRSVNRSARLVNETTGVLRLRFTWTGFVGENAAGQLVLADVFRGAGNTSWIRTLQAGQRLVIVPPEGYIISDSPFGIRDGRTVITGPATLDPDELVVRFEQSTNPPWSPVSSAVIAALAVVVIAGAAAVLLYRRRGADGEAGGDDGRPVPSSSAPSPESNDDSPGPGSAATGGVDASAADDPGDGPTDEELELLSDEERVERLLGRNGGRMRQAAIVDETGWSDAKVSQLLSAMDDDGRVEKLRLGRENLISLPDYDADEE